MKTKLLICSLIGAALTLTACSFAQSATTKADPKALDHDLIVRYLRTRADIMEKSAKIQQPLDAVIADMVLDCKAKKLGDQITLDPKADIPACFAPTPPAAAVAPAPQPNVPKK